MNDVWFEGVSYNCRFYASEIKKGMTLEDFVAQGLADGQYLKYSDSDRVKLLGEAFRLIKEAVAKIV